MYFVIISIRLKTFHGSCQGLLLTTGFRSVQTRLPNKVFPNIGLRILKSIFLVMGVFHASLPGAVLEHETMSKQNSKSTG